MTQKFVNLPDLVDPFYEPEQAKPEEIEIELLLLEEEMTPYLSAVIQQSLKP